jgi:hypothetical protein
MQRETGFGNQATGRLVYQDILVTGWVPALHPVQAQFRQRSYGPLKSCRGCLVTFLQRQDTPRRASGLHAQLHATHHLGGAAFHQALVALEQWVTLCPVSDDSVYLCRELDMGRKARASGTNHSGSTNRFDEAQCHSLSHAASWRTDHGLLPS